MTNLDAMTQESISVLGIAVQISALPDYHDIARRMLARLATRSATALVVKFDKPKGGRPARYSRESLIAAIEAAAGDGHPARLPCRHVRQRVYRKLRNSP